MESALESVRRLSDAEAVQVAKTLFTDLYSNVPYDAVRANADGVAGIAPLLALSGSAMQRELPSDTSASCARFLLERCAEVPSLAPALRDACDRVARSDDMVVDLVLALGLVVNLTLLVASTEVAIEEGEDGKRSWKFTKRALEPDALKAIIEPIVKTVKTLVP